MTTRARIACALVAAGLAMPIAALAQGAGSGSATGSGSASGSGSGSGPRIIQLPTDVNAPEVNASASPTAVRVGGRFTLFVTAIFDPGVTVNLREPLELGSSFEITKKDSTDTPRADGKKIREWQVDVTAWDLGDLMIAPIVVTYTVNGKVGQVETNAVRLRIDGVLGDVVDDPKALRDSHPPTRLIARDWFWLWIGIGAGGLVAAIGAYFWLGSRRRHHSTVRLTGRVVATPRKRIDLTGEKALEALLAIKTSGVIDRDADRKRAYADMVDVIRDYLAGRYRMHTRELTSSELVRGLKNRAPADELALIEGWLERCDRVKYGGMRTTAVHGYGVLDDARALIVTTTQLREAAAQVKEAA